MRNSILVTGVCGFIGHWTALALLDRGYEVVGVDCADWALDRERYEARFKALRSRGGFRYFDFNIAETQGWVDLSAQDCDISHCIHLAGRGGVRRSEAERDEYVASNVRGFINVLNFCRYLPNLRALLYASSSSVYGERADLPFSERDKRERSLSFYAMTKVLNEMLAENNRADFLKIGLRFFTVYGELGRPDMAYDLFSRALMENREITLWEGEELYRDFTHVFDVVRALEELVESDFTRRQDPGELPSQSHFVLNIGSSRQVGVSELVEILSRKLDKTPNIRYQKRPSTELGRTLADISRIKALIDWTPQHSIFEAKRRSKT